MAFRPYENLIDGELDNRTPGKVTGWMRFFRRGKSPLRVTFNLAGDFHEDIRGKVIQLRNPEPSDRNESLDREGTYMEGFGRAQQGAVGDITAGLPLGPWTQELSRNLIKQSEFMWRETGVPESEWDARRNEIAEEHRKLIEAGELYFSYVAYPYVEWFSDNGRVVLELDPSQVTVVDVRGLSEPKEKTPAELVEDRKKRNEAMGDFMAGLVKRASKENRKKGGDGSVFGAVVG